MVIILSGLKTEKTTSKVRQDMKIYEKDGQNYDQSTSKLRARRSEILNFQFFLSSLFVVWTYFTRSFDCLFRRFLCPGLTLLVVFSVFRQVPVDEHSKWTEDRKNYEQSQSLYIKIYN